MEQDDGDDIKKILQINMKENMLLIKRMDREFSLGHQVMFIKEHTKTMR